MPKACFLSLLTLTSLLLLLAACSAPSAPGGEGPDLIVSALDVSPVEVDAGDSVTVSFTVLNQGGAAGRSSTAQLLVSESPDTLEGAVLLTEIATPALAASGTWQHSQAATVPDAMDEGDMWLWLVVDADDRAGQNQVERANDGRIHPLRIGVLLPPACEDPHQPVDIPDLKLRALVVNALQWQQETSDITCWTLSRVVRLVTNLDVGIGAASLEGLQYAVNLRELALPYAQYSDLSPLAALTRLVSLRLYSPHIKDIGPLANMPNLRSVNMISGQIEDLAPLQDLHNLQYITLSSNLIREIGPLVENPGIGEGDVVGVERNCLSAEAMIDVATLEERGVIVYSEGQGAGKCG